MRNPTVPHDGCRSSLATTTTAGIDAYAGRASHSTTSARQLAWVSIVDIAAFFAVLLVGFAYVWRRGDLDWVRAARRKPAGACRQAARRTGPAVEQDKPA